jgi:hypothetical protein
MRQKSGEGIGMLLPGGGGGGDGAGGAASATISGRQHGRSGSRRAGRGRRRRDTCLRGPDRVGERGVGLRDQRIGPV